MQKFNIGDKVKVVGNTYCGYWEPGEAQILTVDGFSYDEDVDVEGKFNTGRLGIQTYHYDDLELVQAVKE